MAVAAPHPDATPQLPRHLAIIMDGNGRWAERRRRPRSFGHRAGAKTVRLCVRFCLERKIDALTLFAFSSENWKRPADEVSLLMTLFLRALDREVADLHKYGVRLRFIGARNLFSDSIRERMSAAEHLTASNTALNLTIAASYGGRWDVLQACKQIARDVQAGVMDVDDVQESDVAQRMALSDIAAPDLFIRTGGDHRISNFLLWQMAYTELWFTDTLWPDLDVAELDRALTEFAQRERRFGLTSAQLVDQQVGHA